MTTDNFRFAIAATFTAEPLRPTIAFWGRELKTTFDIRFANFNQIHQTLLDPGSVFATNTHGINVVLLRAPDLGANTQQIEANLALLAGDLAEAPRRFSSPVIVCLCPSDQDTAFDNLCERVRGVPGLHVLCAADVLNLYPVDEWRNPEGERLGKIPYTDPFFCALGTAIVRFARALVRRPFKVIALDCDNTLWQGICGEDGPEGVVLDEPRRALHVAMLDQRRAGMLLTMASKNNEEDVLETFRVHPEMPLRPELFVTWRLNWESKAENLASIAEQLGVGLDSFIFLDDNPKECAEVQEAVPEVLTLALPAETERIPQFLEHVWAFDHAVVTDEDRKRSEYYAQVAEFGNEVRRASSIEEFMASLKLDVRLAPMSEAQLPRVAQLTQRTNQFNLTAVRRNEQEIRALAGHGYDVYTAEVSDRFGDYGLVGVVITKNEGSDLVVDTMLLSCRVLGRGVEHRVLARLAADTPARSIVLPYVRTAKNRPACQFLDSIDGGERAETADGFRIRISKERAAQLSWKPAKQSMAPPAAAKSVAPKRLHDHGHVATELATVPQIMSAIRRHLGVASFDPSMTDIERQLAVIWAELLERPTVTRTDNFFDLGGHSLVAVLLLLRIRDAFGVDLAIDDVYSGTLTLADLAARIEAAQLGDVNPEEYAAMLAEIEGMSDEEVRQLLEREQEP